MLLQAIFTATMFSAMFHQRHDHQAEEGRRYPERRDHLAQRAHEDVGDDGDRGGGCQQHRHRQPAGQMGLGVLGDPLAPDHRQLEREDRRKHVTGQQDDRGHVGDRLDVASSSTPPQTRWE